jgi:hypothetical protein
MERRVRSIVTDEPARGAAAPSFQPSNDAAALLFAGCYFT